MLPFFTDSSLRPSRAVRVPLGLDLFVQLLGRELKNRFNGSLGGYVWMLLHPLMLLAIYSVLFQTIFKVRFPELEQHPFVAFLAVVLWPWLAFSEAVTRATATVVANAQLVKKVVFRHELLVYASVTAAFVVQAAGYVLVLGVLALAGVTWHLAAWPMVLGVWLLLWLLALALGLVGAAIQVFVRDLEQFLGHAMNVWFYATPLLYPLSLLPQAWQRWIGLNPMTPLMDGLRSALLMTGQTQWAMLLAYLPACTLAWWLGRGFFRRVSRQFEVML